MSAIAEAPFDSAAGDRLAKRNAFVLAMGQALAGANNTVIVATGSILGSMMAPDKSLATMPVSMMVCGMAAGSLPVGVLARRYGRRSRGGATRTSFRWADRRSSERWATSKPRRSSKRRSMPARCRRPT